MSKEFIRGNRDGRNGRNETYTVCRLAVPAKDLSVELSRGGHHHFVTCPSTCPVAQNYSSYKRHAGTEADISTWEAANLSLGGRESLEVIHPEPSSNGETYTICRLGVPRKTLVEEVDKRIKKKVGGKVVTKKLHPRYRTIRVGGEKFVQGIPSSPVDNVNQADPYCQLRGVK